MRTLQSDVDHLHTPAVLRKISIAMARDSSYAAASRNLEDLAEWNADQQEAMQETAYIAKTEPETIEMSSRTARWSGGEPLVKTIVATRRDYNHLRRALAGEAFGRGVNKATSKAFMSNSFNMNWSVWSTHFSYYTAITDLMHALSYAYAAAIASCVKHDGFCHHRRKTKINET